MRENETDPVARRGDGESLWEFASASGMDRRQFLRLLMIGGRDGGYSRLRRNRVAR